MRVVQYGLGPIGAGCARELLLRGVPRGISLVGAIDVDPGKAGRDLASLLEISAGRQVVVSSDPVSELAALRPDVVLHGTGSGLADVADQIEACVRSGAHVVSSCEELLFPFERHPALSERLDTIAREHERVVLGTGVNPGYVMDALALAATAPCLGVRRLEVERVVDAAERRGPLQIKVGAGITPAEFDRRARAGMIGHVGLRESLLFLAHGLGWRLDRIEGDLRPVLAESLVETPHVRVEPGSVAGVHHTASGRLGGREVLSLDLRMYVGAADPHDAIRVDGDPPIDLCISGGVFGDTATVAMLLNTCPSLSTVRPGLRTMQDLPLPRARTSTPR